jgi:hypothetical protein
MEIAKLYLLTQEREVATTAEEKKDLDKQIAAIKYNMERTIAVYGMINVRTDGQKVIIAQKKEKKGGGFIIYELHPNQNGELVFNG